MTPSKKYYQNLERKYGHLKDSCRCQICDRVFAGLGYHIRVHGYTEEVYKDKFGIMRTIPLVAPDVSRKFRKNAKKMISAGLLAQEIHSLGKKNKGKRPLCTAATREFRRKNIKIEISSEKRSAIAKQTYLEKPEIRKKISKTLKIFYKPIKDRRKCGECGKEFFREPSKNKKSINFCSKKCSGAYRSKKLQERNNKILEMHKSGKRIPEIAKEMGMKRQNVWYIVTHLSANR